MCPSLLIFSPVRKALPPTWNLRSSSKHRLLSPLLEHSEAQQCYYTLLIRPCFYYTASLRSLCNFTASLGPRTGAPAAFVINHFIKNIGQEVLSHPLSPINLLNCLLDPSFNCSTTARQEEACTPFPNGDLASTLQSFQSLILGWFSFHNTFQKSNISARF